MFGRKKKDQEDVGMGLGPVPAGTGLEPGADMPAPSPSSSARVTALDIQQKQFGSQRKGYSETEVDEFLDLITEEIVRLSNELKRGGAAPAAGGGAEAEEIKRKARQEADAILADARARSAAMTSGTGASPTASKAEIGAFLAQERGFLHSIAGAIQEHAETIRGMAKAAKDASEASDQTDEAPTSATGAVVAAAETPDDTGAAPTPPTSTSAWSATSPSASAPAAPAVSEGTMEQPAVVQIPPSDVDAPQVVPESVTVEHVVAESDSTLGTQSASVAEVAEPPSAGSTAGKQSRIENQGGQSSLRELFWGED